MDSLLRSAEEGNIAKRLLETERETTEELHGLLETKNKSLDIYREKVTMSQSTVDTLTKLLTQSVNNAVQWRSHAINYESKYKKARKGRLYMVALGFIAGFITVKTF